MDQASSQKFAEAHRALRANDAIQFDLPAVKPPDPPPAWLQSVGHWLARNVFEPIGKFLAWIGSFLPDAPYARIFLWTVLAVAAVALAWIIYERVRYGVWRWPRRRRAKELPIDQPDDWRPDEAPARALLSEADALAQDGLYAQAIHRLLIRSIEDIGRRRPQLIRPALTSRDIAANFTIPPAPRQLFADIAAVVERNLFGGQAVGEAEWGKCRAAYSDFAQTSAWKTR